MHVFVPEKHISVVSFDTAYISAEIDRNLRVIPPLNEGVRGVDRTQCLLRYHRPQINRSQYTVHLSQLNNENFRYLQNTFIV